MSEEQLKVDEILSKVDDYFKPIFSTVADKLAEALGTLHAAYRLAGRPNGDNDVGFVDWISEQSERLGFQATALAILILTMRATITVEEE